MMIWLFLVLYYIISAVVSFLLIRHLYNIGELTDETKDMWIPIFFTFMPIFNTGCLFDILWSMLWSYIKKLYRAHVKYRRLHPKKTVMEYICEFGEKLFIKEDKNETN